jgi:SAM-dependent methyltransferase
VHDDRLRRLRSLFDRVAEHYDAVRPGYPRAVVDDLVALAGLTPGARVLEIGCGTGQLTVELARRGLDVTAVELGASLARLARHHLAPFPDARVVVGAFEDHAVHEPADAVVAALSFHWLPPDVRVVRSAAALRPAGALALIEVSHVAGGTDDFFVEVQRCHERFDPDTPPGLRLPAAHTVPLAYLELDQSPLFGMVERRRHEWEVTYSATTYCELLSTYSTNLALPDDLRDGLLDCIATLIDERYGGSVTKRYLAELVVGRRR